MAIVSWTLKFLALDFHLGDMSNKLAVLFCADSHMVHHTSNKKLEN